MAEETGTQPSPRRYFVDEAGDPVLFNRRKRVVVGNQGCSTYFILGLLDIIDPVRLDRAMTDLRQQLGQTARATVERRFALDKSVDRLLEAIL